MIVVSPAERSDVPAIADLMEELDRFYGATEVDALPARTDQIDAMLFGEAHAASVLLARDEDQVVGLAAYSYLWPAAGLTHSIWLKELYVRKSHQRRGVGTALMRRVCEIAIKSGCSRVEWTTERTNAGAVDFYAKLNALVNADKVFYRLDSEGMGRVAGS